MGTELSLGREKTSGDGGEGLVKALNATELYTEKELKWQILFMYIL